MQSKGFGLEFKKLSTIFLDYSEWTGKSSRTQVQTEQIAIKTAKELGSRNTFSPPDFLQIWTMLVFKFARACTYVLRIYDFQSNYVEKERNTMTSLQISCRHDVW